MDNMVTISNVKTNVLEFEADIQGVDTTDMSVKFVINANGMNIGFDARHLSGTKWEVDIPPLPMLERTAYPFKMDVTSDGYYFEPLQGTINVVGSHDVYVSTPSNHKVEPAKVSMPAPSDTKTIPHKPVEEKSTPLFKKLATKIVETKSPKAKKPIIKSKPKVVAPLMEIAPIKLSPMRKSSGDKTTDDIVKKILTKSQHTENVSTVLKESKVLSVDKIQLKKIPKNQAKKVTPKQVIVESTKVTPKQRKIDETVQSILKLETKPDLESQPTNVNKLKKLN